MKNLHAMTFGWFWHLVGICFFVTILLIYIDESALKKHPIPSAEHAEGTLRAKKPSEKDHRMKYVYHRNLAFDSTINMKTRARQMHRKTTLENTCHRLGLKASWPETEMSLRKMLQDVKLLYSDKYRVMICEIPKCACSSTKKLLLVAEGLVNYSDPQDVSHGGLHDFAEKLLNLKYETNVSQITRRMQHYTKLIIVRDPIYRLVSAYRSKMESEHPWNKDFAKISRDIHANFSVNDGKLATFEEFLRYLSQVNTLERHWDYYHHLCLPCTLEYDFIAHIETIEDDMRYFMDMAGMINMTFPHNYEESKQTNEKKLQKYVSSVQHGIMRKVVTKYKLDFELFGFNYGK